MANALSIITNFIHSIDDTINVDFGENFCADICKHKIYIGISEHSQEDKLIQNFIQERFNILIDPFLIGVLHEVGHLITYEEELNEQRTIMYALISMQYEKKQHEEYAKLYFSIPAELAATTWAVEYYKNNMELCNQFLDELFMR